MEKLIGRYNICIETRVLRITDVGLILSTFGVAKDQLRHYKKKWYLLPTICVYRWENQAFLEHEEPSLNITFYFLCFEIKIEITKIKHDEEICLKKERLNRRNGLC